MRKNSPRKWLHATLDLLPVILIPVFMVYSHRHTIDSGTIEVPQNQIVDFNQIVKNGNFDGVGNWFLTNCIYANNGIVNDTGDAYFGASQNCSLAVNHHFIIRVNCLTNMQTITLFNANGWINSVVSTDNFYYFSGVSTGTLEDFFIGRVDGGQLNDYIEFISINVFDTTQMFGEGNEPTIQQFNQWYTDVYYDYTLTHKELLKNTSTITYSDTDIMSQFTYQLYNSVDKYFNMGNVFNMTSVYDWFNLNIFGGNAPISIYIVWNIVLYEFVMDLLFLLYGLFMWFIDMVEHIMDKPFKSIK